MKISIIAIQYWKNFKANGFFQYVNLKMDQNRNKLSNKIHVKLLGCASAMPEIPSHLISRSSDSLAAVENVFRLYPANACLQQHLLTTTQIAISK